MQESSFQVISCIHTLRTAGKSLLAVLLFFFMTRFFFTTDTPFSYSSDILPSHAKLGEYCNLNFMHDSYEKRDEFRIVSSRRLPARCNIVPA